MFDFIEGAAGREVAAARNQARFDEICLQARVMEDVATRALSLEFLGESYRLPFGIAPMGLCNLSWPGADALLANAARSFGIPLCVSSAASSSIEEMRDLAGDKVWFQLYVAPPVEQSLDLVERARRCGYETLVLTVDVPQVSRRVRDLRNGFTLPFSIGGKQFFDFALHPRWSLTTLLRGAPRPRNFLQSGKANRFDRSASRAAADWDFLDRLRDLWKGRLIVKGVGSSADALKIKQLGVDAIYVSNHGGRQLDSAPAAIDLLPKVRAAVGPSYPLVFDSGVRAGEDIVKALALGADLVMIGRPFLYALGAEGGRGLASLIRAFSEDVSVAMAQIGAATIADIRPDALFGEEETAEDDRAAFMAPARKRA